MKEEYDFSKGVRGKYVSLVPTLPNGNAYNKMNECSHSGEWEPESTRVRYNTHMGRSRYKIFESTHPHFVTCTVLHWIPIFTRTEITNIIYESLKYLQKTDNLKIYAYVILENHLHLIVSSDDLGKTMESFKKYTARCIIDLLRSKNVTTILDQLMFYKKAHKSDRTYQLWQEGIAQKLIQNEQMMIERISYIHNNPVKRGYIDDPIHWRYSRAKGIN